MTMFSLAVLICFYGSATIRSGVDTSMLDLHAFRRKEPVDMASNDEIKQYIEKCPQSKYSLEAICKSRGFSCKGRCGEMTIAYDLSSDLERYSSSREIGCSCDPLCQIYQDCCWDFYKWCPQERLDETNNNYWKSLDGADITCRNGYASISSCVNNNNNNTSDRVPDHDSEDLREPIVSEDGTGLHFKNKTIYTCNEKQIGLQKMARWMKVFQAVNFTHALPHMRDYFLTGQIDQSYYESVRDYPPATVMGRRCLRQSYVICRRIPPQCDDFASMSIPNATWLCQYTNKHYFQDEWYDSTVDFNVSTPDPHFRKTSVSTNSYLHMSCAVQMGSGNKKQLAFKFSIVFDVTDKLEASVRGFEGADGWENVYCAENLVEMLNTSCRTGIKCERSFAYINDSCVKPQNLVLTTESRTEEGTDKMLHTILMVLDEDDVPMTVSFENKMTYETESGGQGLRSEYNFHDYHLEHSDGRSLEVARILIDTLSKQDKNLPFGSSDNASVCLVQTPLHYECEDILVNGVWSGGRGSVSENKRQTFPLPANFARQAVSFVYTFGHAYFLSDGSSNILLACCLFSIAVILFMDSLSAQ